MWWLFLGAYIFSFYFETFSFFKYQFKFSLDMCLPVFGRNTSEVAYICFFIQVDQWVQELLW